MAIRSGAKRRLQHSPASCDADPQILDVTVVLLEAGYASTAVGPIEVFHSAGTIWNWLHGQTLKPRFRVQIASIDGCGVTSLCGLGLKPTCALKDITKTDIIILPASGWDVIGLIANNKTLISWLRKWHSRGAYIAGVCTGVAFLAESGLLDGRQATTHWGVAHIFHQRYPKVHWRTDQFVTEDSRVLCSGGVYASIDLSLYLVEKLCGRDIAIQTAKSLLLSMPRSRQSGYSVLPLSRPHSDEKIKKAEDYLQEHFARDVSVESLATQSAMGQRNFIRRFKAATGRLPGAYLQMLRVNAAKEMLEGDAASVQSVCSNVGYNDLAFFRTIFKRYTGMTPAEYRSRFSRLSYERGHLISGQQLV
jgi:transcriptional regulator GlxA family with amidase domain